MMSLAQQTSTLIEHGYKLLQAFSINDKLVDCFNFILLYDVVIDTEVRLFIVWLLLMYSMIN